MTCGVSVCQRSAHSEALRIAGQFSSHCHVRRKWQWGQRWQCVRRNFHAKPVPVKEFTENLNLLIHNRPTRLGRSNAFNTTNERSCGIWRDGQHGYVHFAQISSRSSGVALEDIRIHHRPRCPPRKCRGSSRCGKTGYRHGYPSFEQCLISKVSIIGS